MRNQGTRVYVTEALYNDILSDNLTSDFMTLKHGNDHHPVVVGQIITPKQASDELYVLVSPVKHPPYQLPETLMIQLDTEHSPEQLDDIVSITDLNEILSLMSYIFTRSILAHNTEKRERRIYSGFIHTLDEHFLNPKE